MRENKNTCVKKSSKSHPNKDFGTTSIRQATGFVPVDDDELSEYKCGLPKSLEVTNEIAQITKASENLCSYSAMYNALRSSALREAFSSFDLFCAAKEFVELSKTNVGECTGYIQTYRPGKTWIYCYGYVALTAANQIRGPHPDLQISN